MIILVNALDPNSLPLFYSSVSSLVSCPVKHVACDKNVDSVILDLQDYFRNNPKALVVLSGCLPAEIVEIKREYNSGCVTLLITDGDYNPPKEYYPYQYLMAAVNIPIEAAQVLNLLENHTG